MNYQWDFSSVLRYQNLLWDGLWGTALLSFSGVICAMIIGLVVVLARLSPYILLRAPAVGFVNFFRNIPFIVQLFWFFYAVPVLTGFQASPFLAAFSALSLYGGAYFAEIYRAGIQSLEQGQWEGAKAIGLGEFATLRYVILPQALRRIVPPLTTQIIELAKLTTVASTIAYFELLYAGKLIADQDLRPIEAYTTVAFILITIFIIVSFLSVRIERRFQASAR